VPRARLRWRSSAAFGVALLPTAPALTGVASLSLVPESSGLGAFVRAAVVASRSIDLAGGSARYSRWPLEVGGLLRFAGATVSGELELGAALGWLSVEGRSFSPNRRANDVTYGPAAALRLLGSRGTARPFVELASTYWPKVARIYGDPSSPSTTLPSLELAVFLGVAVLP
jgi:hypothetical protein